jgi:hypothetical protein
MPASQTISRHGSDWPAPIPTCGRADSACIIPANTLQIDQLVSSDGDSAESAKARRDTSYDMHSDPTEIVIARFRAALETVQAAELERLYFRLPQMTDSSREEIRQFSERIVAHFLEQPLKSLSEETNTSSPPPLLDAFQQLFQLSRRLDASLTAS